MLLDGLTIALRPRSPWEATDLGVALLRTHAARVWSAWVLITLPVCLLLAGLSVALASPWLGGVLLWWIKPVFDRIPLFVLSRAVFGERPTLRQTLRAQWDWGWGALRWLHWRRLHPGRALLLPVDLLEQLRGATRRERCRVLSRGSGSPGLMLSVVGWHIETMLYLSIIALALMFVPVEFLPDSFKAVWETLFLDPPPWAQGLPTLIYWMAVSIMEPFYVGAGFGLYLNRRTQLEAWDIELAFRRLAMRLKPGAIALALGLALVLALPAARAQSGERPVATGQPTAVETSTDTQDEKPAQDLRVVFSRQYRGDGDDFERAVASAYRDPNLGSKKTIQTWQPRHRDGKAASPQDTMPVWMKGLANVIAFLAENGLWILVGLLIAVLVRYHAHWLPWLSDRFIVERRADPVEIHDLAIPDTLPDDLPAAIRALWQAGKPRAALALFYRAAVQRLTDALGAPLPPGATEAECLRQARRLDDRDYAGLFARIVRSWQAMAYAQRRPSDGELDTLLADWQRAPEAGP